MGFRAVGGAIMRCHICLQILISILPKESLQFLILGKIATWVYILGSIPCHKVMWPKQRFHYLPAINCQCLLPPTPECWRLVGDQRLPLPIFAASLTIGSPPPSTFAEAQFFCSWRRRAATGHVLLMCVRYTMCRDGDDAIETSR